MADTFYESKHNVKVYCQTSQYYHVKKPTEQCKNKFWTLSLVQLFFIYYTLKYDMQKK